MATNTLKTRIKHAYKTESEWSSSDPILLIGEIAVSSDKDNFKIGDGTSTWSQLSYIIPTNISEFNNDSGFITSSGTASKANQLTNARTIDGMNFNGTANIHHYAVCSSSGSSYSKTVSLSGFVLSTGARVFIKFDNDNTSSSTLYLNVNSTGSKQIRYGNGAIAKGVFKAGKIYEFLYDGTYWAIVGELDTNTKYTAGTGLSLSGTTFNHKNSVTAGTAQGDASKTLSFGGTFSVPTVTYDAQGHITAKGTTTMTMPANPNTWRGIQDNLTSTSTTDSLSAAQGKTLKDLIDGETVTESDIAALF